ncbi:hypothetical protein M438DRAFT_322881 [Aureobasidium pullulans EXF-150]|uniref:Uncharacterized protein n=1 Tax=Aureobasidium pullulans EXF-150 TaxID=1043002 RepID=A0A074XJD1_AURPU|nr:uncharacterized protein M438DRAFT_322881 [Aureobasidium pullulans EXF-150]KEQ82142.1 hypothetical protein M438DRAFT_322881 [Aureobasidium pullulans EXF-150]
MVTIEAVVHKNTADLAQYLNDQRPHPPRNFVPDLIEGAQVKPCTGWMDLGKPPQNGWWADRQTCQCPPCYYYHLTDQVNNGSLPFSVAVPLAQLINVGLIRLNFRHPQHENVFTAEDKDYARSLHRDICYGINSGQLPLQLMEILLIASRKAVLKSLTAEDPEYHHKEFEMYLKRAIQKYKDEGKGPGLDLEDNTEQAQAGAQAEDEESAEFVSDEDNGIEKADMDHEVPHLWTGIVAEPTSY